MSNASSHRNLRLLIASVLAVSVAAASCGDDATRPPTQPTAPDSPPNTPPAAPAISRLELSAPESIEPGASAQLTLRAVKSDGSTEDVTLQAQWTSYPSHVLTVDVRGVATGHARGGAIVQGALPVVGGGVATRNIYVLPAGTFSVSGVVTDQGTPIPGVAVEVIRGVGEGQRAMTGSDGQYTLYGVAGHLRLHAKREGYENTTDEVNIAGHTQHPIAMTIKGSRLRVDGIYTLTITGTCASRPASVPADSLRRSYTATVEQQDRVLAVHLSGADFLLNEFLGDRFTGDIAPTGEVRFLIGPDYYDYYYRQMGVAERVSPTQTFYVNGVVRGRAEGGRITGLMEGRVALSPRTSWPLAPFSLICDQVNHGFELVRR